MRNILLPVLLILIASVSYSQTLFTYGNKPVSKSEFVKAFDKNPSADTVSRKQALRDYLDLYIKYKLKVQAAHDEKLDQTDEYKSESNNFKRELAETAINNEANINSLVREAFLRSSKDIQLSQIFIPAASASDTTAALSKVNEAYSLLQKGKPFTDVVKQFSQDSVAKQNGGDIGYITAFTLPYEAENLVYNLQVGQYSKPYHSRIGYHIFKVTNIRSALGKRKIQYILFATSPVASEAEKLIQKNVADSVYNLLQSGASFADMQAMFSAKKGSSNNTTDVSVGQYNPDFESPVFALKNEGDISKPFATAYGYNIVKLIEKIPALQDTNDLTIKAAMQEKVTADDRLSIARQSLQSKWQAASGYKPVLYNKKDLWKFTDTALTNGNASLHYKTINNNSVLFSFSKEKVTASDWLKFVQMKIQGGNRKPNIDYPKWMPQFISYAVTNYYKEHIEDFHPDLKAQLDEFNDANLLFAAMDKHVWGKASQDSTGLLQYYKAHSKNYVWAPGADAIIVSANSKQVASELAEKIKEAPLAWRQLVNSYGSLAQADSSRFEKDQLQVKDADMTAGYVSEPTAINSGSNYTFTYITAIHNQPESRSFEDARGIVINDYQGVVEDKWINELKKKYPVKVNEAVFESIH